MLAKDVKGAFQDDKEYGFDQVATAYPLWAGGEQGREELETMSERIAQHGQRIPIILCTRNGETKIADGRRRYESITKGKACKAANVKPWFILEDDVDSLPDLARDLNEHRRMLTTIQLLASIERMMETETKLAAERMKRENKQSGEAKKESPPPTEGAEEAEQKRKEEGKATARVAKRLGVGTSYVEKSVAITKDGVEPLQKLLKDDKISVAAAYTVSKMPADMQKDVVKAIREGASVSEAIREAKQEVAGVKDQMGSKVPGTMKHTFLAIDDLKLSRSAIGTACGRIKEVLKSKKDLCPTTLLQAAVRDLEDIRVRIEQAEAYTYCRNCKGRGCKACHDRGWLSREQVSKLGKDAKKALENGESE